MGISNTFVKLRIKNLIWYYYYGSSYCFMVNIKELETQTLLAGNQNTVIVSKYIYIYIYVSLHVWTGWVVNKISWVFDIISTFRNIFTWKTGDVFNSYFTHCIHRERVCGILSVQARQTLLDLSHLKIENKLKHTKIRRSLLSSQTELS